MSAPFVSAPCGLAGGSGVEGKTFASITEPWLLILSTSSFSSSTSRSRNSETEGWGLYLTGVFKGLHDLPQHLIAPSSGLTNMASKEASRSPNTCHHRCSYLIFLLFFPKARFVPILFLFFFRGSGFIFVCCRGCLDLLIFD